MAARDLSTCEIIIQQSPLVIGPIANDDNAPVCLGCYQAVEIDAPFRYEHHFYVNICVGFMTLTTSYFIFIDIEICALPDVQTVNFRSAPNTVLAEIIQRLSVSSLKLTIYINICIGKRTDPSFSTTTKQSPS